MFKTLILSCIGINVAFITLIPEIILIPYKKQSLQSDLTVIIKTKTKPVLLHDLKGERSPVQFLSLDATLGHV